MKFSALLILLGIAVSANCQDKPRVFVQGKGSQNVSSNGSGGGGSHWGTWGSKSTIDSHDESMEVTKDLQKECPGVTVTLNDSNADYVIMMNRESKQNRGLLRSNSQVEVANKAGDILGSNATHTVGHAAKDACNLIMADWQAHGRLNIPQQAAAPVQQAPVAQPVLQQAAQTSATPQVVPAVATSEQPAADAAPAAQPESLGDAAKREKQHRACLDLAKDNPSVVCK